MDPLSVLRTIWRNKWFALPAIIIAVAGAVYFYVEGPRTYESSAAYALANPDVPTDREIEADPTLLQLNSNNPYLRSSDPNLVANVVITRLNATETAENLKSQGIDSEYTVSSGALGGGLVVSINASGSTPDESVEATDALGALMQQYLYDVQKVNGADDRYLFTSILVSAPGEPTEKISSRLRNVIVVGIGGVILVFAAVSLGTFIDRSRQKKRLRSTARDLAIADERVLAAEEENDEEAEVELESEPDDVDPESLPDDRPAARRTGSPR